MASTVRGNGSGSAYHAARASVVSSLLVVMVALVPEHALADRKQGPLAGQSAAQPAVCSSAWLANRAAGGVSGLVTAPAYAEVGAAAAPRAPSDARTGRSGPENAFVNQEPASRYPNDTYFRLYQRNSLMQMGALDAWETSHGGSDVVIAVIGTGVDYAHPDLVGKMWRNPGEIPGNGTDDDENGFVDDVVGWSFPDDSNAPLDIPRGRGTMMAGIAAAHSNNNEGITGVSWGARIMALKTLVLRQHEDGDKFVGTVNDLVRAVCYATDNSAKVILFGGYLQNPAAVAADLERLRQAVEYAHTQGVIVVAPAGDCAERQEFCPPEEYYPDPPIFPAAFRHVIGVQTFTAGLAERTEASSGDWVDISAPGEEFMTTSADPPYSYVRHQRATSDFGAAHVAGVAAVMRSINPNITPYQVEQSLCETATRPRDVEFEYPPAGPPRNDTWGCGMVNFEKSLESVPPLMRVVPLTGVAIGRDALPRVLWQVTDGNQPWPQLRFENPYLSASAWHVVADVAWMGATTSWDLHDGTSGGGVVANLDLLRDASGPLQSGNVYTAELKVCARDWTADRSPCQAFAYRLTVVERLERVYLPFVVE